MQFLSVCSGIEAASVAWEPLGWEALAYSEIAKFPRALLEHHYPFTDCHNDFTTIGSKYYGTTDVLIGGTPCQDFSVAGLRKGLAGDRGNLTIEFVRLVKENRPRWVVWENVPGVLSIDRGKAFGTFLAGLAECGYGFAYRVLDAQYFGVPQRRRRVFVIGYIGNWRPAASVLFECEGLRWDIAPRRKTRESITHDIAASLTNSGRGTERTGDPRGQDTVIPVAPTLDGRCDRSGANNLATSGGLISHTLRGEGFDASEDGSGRGIPLIAGCLQERDSKGCDSDTKPGHLIPFYSDMSGTQRSVASDVSLTIKTARSNAICIKGASIGREPQNGPQYGEILEDDSCYTLNATETHAIASFKTGQSAQSRSIAFNENLAPSLEAGGGGNNKAALMQGMGVRRLTPRECERLMGFPDDYTLVPFGKKNRPATDGHRYRALGNSMAVPVIRWLGERIAAVDQLF